MNWLSFLVGALVGWLVGWLIDYLICRPRRMAAEADLLARSDSSSKETSSLKAQLAEMKDLRADLDACRSRVRQQHLEIERLNADLEAARASAVAGMGASAMRATEAGMAMTTAAPQPGKPDDLTRIEGIGPKISALLNENGIRTFAQLAATNVERLQSILSVGGSRFGIADPRTWPEQALLARDGKWDALEALQNSLKGGRKA